LLPTLQVPCGDRSTGLQTGPGVRSASADGPCQPLAGRAKPRRRRSHAECVKEFLVASAAAATTLWLSRQGRGAAAFAPAQRSSGPDARSPRVDAGRDVLAEFRRYLLEERGIASTSANSYVHVAASVPHRAQATPPGFSRWLGSGQTWCPLSPSSAACATPPTSCAGCVSCPSATADLRGLTPRALWPEPFRLRPTGAWRLYRKPWSTTTCRRYSKAVIRRTTFRTGRRLAMLAWTRAARLRAGEVAALELSDIDWRRRRKCDPGKGAQDRPPSAARRRRRGIGCMAAARPWLVLRARTCFTRVRAPEAAASRARGLGVVTGGVPSCLGLRGGQPPPAPSHCGPPRCCALWSNL